MTFTHAFTRDLETEGHVMVYVTFVISACIWPIAMIFSLFRKDFRSGNSFQLSPFAWPQRLTLKLNVTSCLRDISHFCLYLCYRKDFFCFATFLGQGIHSNYCHSRYFYVWPWNSRSRHGLRDICYFWPLVCVIPQWFFCFVRFSDQGIHSDYCHLRDHHEWPWNVKSRRGLRV